MVSRPLLDTIIEALFLSIQNISNELERTTDELIEYNNQYNGIDLRDKANNQDDLDLAWKTFEDEIKLWTDLLHLKIRRYQELKHETMITNAKPAKWLALNGRYFKDTFRVLETLEADVRNCKEQLYQLRGLIRFIINGELTESNNTHTNIKKFVQKEIRLMKKILLEKKSVLNQMKIAFEAH